jgi:hypothetical protein
VPSIVVHALAAAIIPVLLVSEADRARGLSQPYGDGPDARSQVAKVASPSKQRADQQRQTR